MAQKHSQARETLRAQTEAGTVNPLDLTGAPPLAVWDELVDEAKTLIELVQELKCTPKGEAGREDKEQRLLTSLAHLRMHTDVLDESVTNALELADELELANP